MRAAIRERTLDQWMVDIPVMYRNITKVADLGSTT